MYVYKSVFKPTKQFILVTRQQSVAVDRDQIAERKHPNVKEVYQMTTNQIAYWQLQETKRANREKEGETARHNRHSEQMAERGADAADEKNTISRESIFTQAATADKDRVAKMSIADADRSSKESIARQDRRSKERIADADRTSRERISENTLSTERDNLLSKFMHESTENELAHQRGLTRDMKGKQADLIIQRNKDKAAMEREMWKSAVGVLDFF